MCLYYETKTKCLPLEITAIHALTFASLFKLVLFYSCKHIVHPSQIRLFTVSHTVLHILFCLCYSD